MGSTTARGSFGTDSFPTGTLTFDSGGQPFNLVEIRTAPNQPNGVSFFLVDNIAAEVVPVPEPTQAGLFAALACGLAGPGANRYQQEERSEPQSHEELTRN